MEEEQQAEIDNKYRRNQLQEDFVGNVTLHGYRYLFVSGKKRRCIWWIFFLGAIVFAVWLFYGAVSDYFEYKTSTTVEYDYDLTKVTFPTLTFCFHQPYTRQNARKFPLKADNNFFDTMYNQVLIVRRKPPQSVKDLLGELEAKGIDTYEKLIDLLTVNTNETLHSSITKAIYARVCTMNNIPCKSNDFKTILDENFSPCKQYNYYSADKKGKTQTYPSRTYWFEAYFLLQDSKALGLEDKGKGITLFLHDRNRPHYEVFDIQLTLQAGFLTTVTIDELKTMHFLTPPYGKCGSLKYRIIQNFPYSVSMCRIDCDLESLYRQCGCVDFRFKDFVGNTTICTTLQMVECYKRNHQGPRAFLHRNCRNRCVHECVQNKYPVRSEISSLISDKNRVKLKQIPNWNMDNQDTEKYILNNIVGLKIGFGNIVQRNETTTPSVSIPTLLGTIGGSIGLGLGFSVLTLVEFLLFFMDYISLCLPCTGGQPVRPDRPV